jgi:outer membrane protein assembly factor BamB
MNFSKIVYTIVVLSLLLFVSDSFIFSGLQQSTVNAVDTSGNGAELDSSALLQYEWPQCTGDSSYTRFSAGPAPEAPDILWQTNITGIQSYLAAFNGMLFATTTTTVFALDKETGGIIWNTTVPSPGPGRWPEVYKIDDTHMVVGSSCLDIATGRVLWTSANFSTNANTYGAGVYSPEEKMFYAKTKSYVNAWDFTDPSKIPTLVWSTYVRGGDTVGSGVQYGDGKVFPGSFMSHQMALDAKTGDIVWDTETTGAMVFAGAYYDGKFLRGSPYSNVFYCFDADNGEILWTFKASTQDGYWCTGCAAAYGMVYELNKDGNLYALDVNTGEVVWTYKGPDPLFFPGNPIVADGKVYATTSQSASYNPETGSYSTSEFMCLDAYTGQPIWRLPIEAYPPRESTAIAYGNLYIIPGFIQAAEMDKYTTFNQVWAIGTRSWSMWRHDSAHTGVGQSGQENLTLRWKFATNGAVISSPSVVDGRAYFGSQDKNIYCVDAYSGTLIWNFTTSNRVASSMAVANGKVYTGADDGNVYCLDAYNGSLIWSAYAGGNREVNYYANILLCSSPVVVGNIVYVGALDNKTYAFNATTGAVIWTYITKGYITASPAVSNNTVYVLSQEPSSGCLYVLNADTGAFIKNVSVPYQQTNRGTDLESSPSVAGDMVFVASNKKAYYGINVTSGSIQWTFKDDEADEFITCSPVYNAGKIYVVDEFYILCLDSSTGNLIWRSDFLGAELYVSPTYADGKLYIVSDQRSIYVLNATTGSKISYFGTDSNSWSSATLYEGRLYVGNNDWNVYCLANYPVLSSTLALALDKTDITPGALVTGCGQLSPGMINETVLVTLNKPDGTSTVLEVTTSDKGGFSFDFTPTQQVPGL